MDWLRSSSGYGLHDAACVSLISGVSVTRIEAAFGLRAVEIGTAGSEQSHSSEVKMHTADGIMVIVEPASFRGTQPGVLKAASRDGKLASVYWDVNDMVIVGLARRGKLVALGEISDIEPNLYGRRSGARLPELTTDWPQLAFATVERFVGVRLTRTLLKSPSTLYRLEPRVQLPITREELVGLQIPDAETVDLVLAASLQTRRELAEWAALQGIAAAGLQDDPAVASVTAQFRPGAVATLSVELQARMYHLDETILNEFSDDEQSDPSLMAEYKRQYGALLALAYACTSDEVTAALGALKYSCGHPRSDHARLLAAAARKLRGGS